MPFLILIVLVVVFWVLLNQTSTEAKPVTSQAPLLSNDVADSLVYLSKGKLFLKAPKTQTEEIHSQYIQDVLSKSEKSKHLHGWKEGTAWGQNFAGKQTNQIDDVQAIKFRSVQPTAEGTLLYFLKDQNFGGLFEYDLSSKKEKRLLHKQNLDYQDIAFNDTRNSLVCSNHYSNGIANIVIANKDGSEFREITGGDTVDSNPAWVNDQEASIVYQSKGQARSDAGYVIAHGPASILLLDYDSGQLETILEDDAFDFLSPKVRKNGNLLYIKRPFEQESYDSNSALKDTLFFPFRLLRAVFHFLNFFSLMYSKKPLTSASGPEVKAELKDIVLQGKRIDAEKALQQKQAVNGVPSLVPGSWRLIERNTQGKERVVATHVASFNLCKDDSVTYSNGCAVFKVTEDGTQLLHKDKLIESAVTIS